MASLLSFLPTCATMCLGGCWQEWLGSPARKTCSARWPIHHFQCSIHFGEFVSKLISVFRLLIVVVTTMVLLTVLIAYWHFIRDLSDNTLLVQRITFLTHIRAYIFNWHHILIWVEIYWCHLTCSNHQITDITFVISPYWHTDQRSLWEPSIFQGRLLIHATLRTWLERTWHP